MVLRYKLGLQAPGATDVSKRKLSVTVGDQPTVIHELEPAAREYNLDLQPGDAVAVSLVDVDASGNESQPSAVLAFTAIDTIPPPAPATPVINEVTQVD